LPSIAHLLTMTDTALCYTTFVKIIRSGAGHAFSIAWTRCGIAENSGIRPLLS
jgi:hypothetical protein